jgi:hypothetical protein
VKQQKISKQNEISDLRSENIYVQLFFQLVSKEITHVGKREKRII